MTISSTSHIAGFTDNPDGDEMTERMQRAEVKRRRRRSLFGVPELCIAVALIIFGSFSAWGTEVQIPAMKVRSGQDIKIPVIIDQISNLAGVKLILHYDKEFLSFTEGSKSPDTQSMMHIINDKTPGKLIIVMAGAKGVRGKEMILLTLTFAAKKGLTVNHTMAIDIPEVQLMGDDLKEIKCKVKPGTLVIHP